MVGVLYKRHPKVPFSLLSATCWVWWHVQAVLSKVGPFATVAEVEPASMDLFKGVAVRGGCSEPWCGGALWLLVANAGTPAGTGGALDTLLWHLTWNETGEELGVRADSISPFLCL